MKTFSMLEPALLLVFAFCASGCISTGIPAAKDYHPTEMLDKIPKKCVDLLIIPPDITTGNNKYEVLEESDLFIEILEDSKVFKSVDYNRGQSIDTSVKVRIFPKHFILNEPYLMVVSLGLIPQPVSTVNGFKFSLASNPDEVIDTTYLSTSWFGWFALPITLHPNQVLFGAEEHHRDKSTRDVLYEFKRLGVFDQCD